MLSFTFYALNSFVASGLWPGLLYSLYSGCDKVLNESCVSCLRRLDGLIVFTALGVDVEGFGVSRSMWTGRGKCRIGISAKLLHAKPT